MAEATTCTGDVDVSFSVGLVMVKGKSFEAVGGGSCAGGAGSGLVDGDQVIGTGGVEGAPGGVEVGVGVGVGVGVVVPALLTPPHAVNVAASDNTTMTQPRRCQTSEHETGSWTASATAGLISLTSLWRTSSSARCFELIRRLVINTGTDEALRCFLRESLISYLE